MNGPERLAAGVEDDADDDRGGCEQRDPRRTSGAGDGRRRPSLPQTSRAIEPPSPATAPSEPVSGGGLSTAARPDAPPLPQREQLAAWEASLAVSGLPLAGLDSPRRRARGSSSPRRWPWRSRRSGSWWTCSWSTGGRSRERPRAPGGLAAGRPRARRRARRLARRAAAAPDRSSRPTTGWSSRRSTACAPDRARLAAACEPTARRADAPADAGQGRPRDRLRPPPARRGRHGAAGPRCRSRRCASGTPLRSRARGRPPRRGARGALGAGRDAPGGAFARPRACCSRVLAAPPRRDRLRAGRESPRGATHGRDGRAAAVSGSLAAPWRHR